MATAVKESLLGSEREESLSFQSKASFDLHAKADEQTGEKYMNKDDFVDAIAPTSENYVCHMPFPMLRYKSILIMKPTA